MHGPKIKDKKEHSTYPMMFLSAVLHQTNFASKKQKMKRIQRDNIIFFIMESNAAIFSLWLCSSKFWFFSPLEYTSASTDFFYDALTGMWLEEKMTLAVSSYCLFHFRVLEVVDKRLGAICVHFTQICVFHKLPYSCCNCTGMRKYSFIIYLPNANHSWLMLMMPCRRNPIMTLA